MGKYPPPKGGYHPAPAGLPFAAPACSTARMNPQMNPRPLKDARNLSRQPPRSPRQRLDGYALMPRMIDKGRATIAGTAGEYHFDCPVDNLLFSFKGVKGADVRAVLESGASDLEILEWFNAH